MKRLCAHCGRKPARRLSVARDALIFCSQTCAAIEAFDTFQHRWCEKCGAWSHQDDWSLTEQRYDETRCPNCER